MQIHAAGWHWQRAHYLFGRYCVALAATEIDFSFQSISFGGQPVRIASEFSIREGLPLRACGASAREARSFGPGCDRNLFTPRAILASLDYIHDNPVKRGLCERVIDWPWSSARYYLMDNCFGCSLRL